MHIVEHCICEIKLLNTDFTVQVYALCVYNTSTWLHCIRSWKVFSHKSVSLTSSSELSTFEIVNNFWLGTSRWLLHCEGLSMTVCGADVRPVKCVRDLGVLIDSNTTLSNHVNSVAGICFYQLHQLRIIRHSLTTDAAHSLVQALIHIRVDYCNGLLLVWSTCTRNYSLSFREATRLVLQLPYRAYVYDIMWRQLHWLEMLGSRQVQTVYAGIQMPTRTRSSLSVRSLQPRC